MFAHFLDDFVTERLDVLGVLAQMLECLACRFSGGVNRSYREAQLVVDELVYTQILAGFLCCFDKPCYGIGFLRRLLALSEELHRLISSADDAKGGSQEGLTALAADSLLATSPLMRAFASLTSFLKA